MKQYRLPITAGYVLHWGFWEAVREIAQNCKDECTRNPQCTFDMRYDDTRRILSLDTSQGSLHPRTLLLGQSNKRSDASMIGKFGEGYKLALLVLQRPHKGVVVRTDRAAWTPAMEYDNTFDEEILVINEMEAPPMQGVSFSIHNVTPSEWAVVRDNIRMNKPTNVILLDEPGRIYIGGLYACTVKEYVAGYDLSPTTVRLDRDRGMVDDFDLSYQTSRMWTRDKPDSLLDLIEKKAPDVRYCSSHATSQVSLVYASYSSRYGKDTYPVSTQAEVERATAAGVKWRLVPEQLKTLLSKVRTWFIPSRKSPYERLKDFYSRVSVRLDDGDKAELEDILRALAPKVESEVSEEIK